MRIYKYRLELGDQHVYMPAGSELLCVDFQTLAGDRVPVLHVWAAVDDAPTVVRMIRVVMTGEDNVTGEYVGSAVSNSWVLHVFDLGEQAVN